MGWLTGTESFTIWENPIGTGNGFFVSKADYEADTGEYSENVFENQNRLSQLLFHSALIDCVEETYTDDENGTELSYQFHADGTQILYLYGKDLLQATITVNGETLQVPDYENLDNETYPATGNQGIISLGYFEDADITVEISQSARGSGEEKKIFFGFLNPAGIAGGCGRVEGSGNIPAGKSSCEYL